MTDAISEMITWPVIATIIALSRGPQKAANMTMWKRGLSTPAALFLLLAGLGSGVVAFTVIAWPATNVPEGRADDWLIAAPYIIAAAVFFGAAAFILWRGFRQRDSSALNGPQ